MKWNVREQYISHFLNAEELKFVRNILCSKLMGQYTHETSWDVQTPGDFNFL
jgi:hypothetical protein